MVVSPDALYRTIRQDLSDYVSLELIDLDLPSPDLSIRQMSCYSLNKSFLKKFQTSVRTDPLCDKQALDKFVAVNHKCKEWSLVLRNSLQETIHGEVKNFLYRFWNPGGYELVDSFEQLFHHGRVGPGSSIGSVDGSFYSKLFSSPLTASCSTILSMYRHNIKKFPDWASAEFLRQTRFGEPHVVDCNKFLFVPKNDAISRSICVEPTLNMWYQLGFASHLDKRLRLLTGIDFETQADKNRQLARKGSLGFPLSTIDLSSASDSISVALLREILPKGFLRILTLLRSEKTVFPDGSKVPLYMISTMGNGTTFSLQTIIFTAIVLSVYKVFDRKIIYPRGREHGNFGVFGDDIICDSRLSSIIIDMLETYGFSVNVDKTFIEGPFKESCGHDYYHGCNVRGFYLKKLRTIQDSFVAINGLNDFSARSGVLLRRSISLLRKNVPWVPVPAWELDDSGIRVPEILSPKTFDSNGSFVFRRCRPRPKRVLFSDCDISSRKLLYNPFGLYICVLNGSVNYDGYSVRHDTINYRFELGVAPSWGGTELDRSNSRSFWKRWDAASYLNLLG